MELFSQISWQMPQEMHEIVEYIIIPSISSNACPEQCSMHK